MKITGIETHVLVGQLAGQAFGWSQRVTGTRQAVLCSITTDTGLEGVGEAFYFGGPATVVATLIRDGLGPLVMSRNPMDTSVIWDTLYNWTRDQGQKGVTISALSAYRSPRCSAGRTANGPVCMPPASTNLKASRASRPPWWRKRSATRKRASAA